MVDSEEKHVRIKVVLEITVNDVERAVQQLMDEKLYDVLDEAVDYQVEAIRIED